MSEILGDIPIDKQSIIQAIGSNESGVRELLNIDKRNFTNYN